MSAQPAGGVILRSATGVVIGDASGRSILPSTAPFVFHVDGPENYSIIYENCCDLSWQCNSDQDWAAGHQALQANACELPGLLSIVGDPDFVAYFERALDLLKNRLPYRYAYALDGLNQIEQITLGGKWNSYLYAQLRTFFVAWQNGGPAHGGGRPRTGRACPRSLPCPSIWRWDQKPYM